MTEWDVIHDSFTPYHVWRGDVIITVLYFLQGNSNSNKIVVVVVATAVIVVVGGGGGVADVAVVGTFVLQAAVI